MDEIFEKGFNKATGDYDIPAKFYLVKDIIKEQLEILKSFEDSKEIEKSPPKKMQKTSKSSQDDVKPVISDNSNSDDDMQLSGPSTSSLKTEESKTSPKTPIKKAKIEANLQDFFKARAAQQKVKFEEEKKKEIPSASTSKSNLEKKKDFPVDLAQFFPVIPKKGQMATKLKNAAPYNMFLTTITANKVTHKESLSVTFQELLDDSLGELESSVQINFMIDIGWLYANYCFTGNGDLPLLLLYGDETPELKTIASKKPNVTAIKVQINTPYGEYRKNTSEFPLNLLKFQDVTTQR